MSNWTHQKQEKSPSGSKASTTRITTESGKVSYCISIQYQQPSGTWRSVTDVTFLRFETRKEARAFIADYFANLK